MSTTATVRGERIHLFKICSQGIEVDSWKMFLTFGKDPSKLANSSRLVRGQCHRSHEPFRTEFVGLGIGDISNKYIHCSRPSILIRERLELRKELGKVNV